MKQIFNFFVIIIICVFSQEPAISKVLQGNVSIQDNIPNNFYGTWIVTGVIASNNIQNDYKSTSVDVWTLVKYDNIIVLENPLSGAYAQISVDEVSGNTIKFSRKSGNASRLCYEAPAITLNGENFVGVDDIIFEYRSGGNLVRRDILKYKIVGRKFTSQNLFE